MKVTEFKEDSVCDGKAAIVNNKFLVDIKGTVRGGTTVEKALKAVVLDLRSRRSEYGYFPCYVIDLDGQGTRIYTVEG